MNPIPTWTHLGEKTSRGWKESGKSGQWPQQTGPSAASYGVECRSHRNPRLQQNGRYSNYHWNQGEHAVMSAVGWGVKRPAERGAHLELLQQCRQEWGFHSIRQRARGWPQNLSEWRKGNGQQLKRRSLREDSAGKQGLSLASHWRCLML